jgi:hypothetical protein
MIYIIKGKFDTNISPSCWDGTTSQTIRISLWYGVSFYWSIISWWMSFLIGLKLHYESIVKIKLANGGKKVWNITFNYFHARTMDINGTVYHMLYAHLRLTRHRMVGKDWYEKCMPDSCCVVSEKQQRTALSCLRYRHGPQCAVLTYENILWDDLFKWCITYTVRSSAFFYNGWHTAILTCLKYTLICCFYARTDIKWECSEYRSLKDLTSNNSSITILCFWDKIIYHEHNYRKLPENN